MKDGGRENRVATALMLIGNADLEERLGQSYVKYRLLLLSAYLRRGMENLLLDSAQVSAYVVPRLTRVIVTLLADVVGFLCVAAQVVCNRWMIMLLIGAALFLY